MRFAGDRQVARIVTRDLNEQAVVRAALVELTRGVQEPGSVAERGRQPQMVPKARANGLKERSVLACPVEVRHEGHVVSRPRLAEEPTEITLNRLRRMPALPVELNPVQLEQRSVIRKPALGAELRQQPVGVVLALLHVRLVESVDAEQRARGRGRHFPAEKFLAKVQFVRQFDPDHRVSGAFERAQSRLDRAGLRAVVAVRLELQVDKQPVFSVACRLPQLFAGDGHETLAFLPGALGDELLRPVAESLDFRRRDERDLVPPGARRLRHDDAELHPGIIFGRHAAGAGVDHALRPFQQGANVDALERGRNNAEIRERRIPAPDVRLAVNDRAKLVLPRQLFERSPGIGDGDKIFARPVALELLNAVVEVFEEGQALGGAARFARDQEERSRWIDRLLQPRNTFRDG